MPDLKSSRSGDFSVWSQIFAQLTGGFLPGWMAPHCLQVRAFSLLKNASYSGGRSRTRCVTFTSMHQRAAVEAIPLEAVLLIGGALRLDH